MSGVFRTWRGLRGASAVCSVRRSGGRPVSADSAEAAVRSETGQLLQRLVWRAKEVLFANGENAKKGEKARGVAAERGDNRMRASQLRVLHTDATGLFDVAWSEASRTGQGAQGDHSTASSSELTREKSLTLLCELFAIALRMRRGAASPEFLSWQVTMMVPPLKAAEAIYAPLSRQARLWGEQRDWHVLMASAATTFERICDECTSEEEIRGVAQQFLDQLETLCLPAAVEGMKGRRHNHRKGDKKELYALHDTLSNTLWRVTMLCRVVESLLGWQRQTPGLLSADGSVGHDKVKERDKTDRFEIFVKSLVQEMEKRVFIFYSPNGTVEKVEGLEALVEKAFHYCCGSEHTDTRLRTHKRGLGDALLSFCGAYFKIMLFSLSIKAVDAEVTSAVKHDDCRAVTIVRTIRQCWSCQQTTMHLHGVQRAFWWLRLVPILFNALFEVTDQMNKTHLGIVSCNAHLETLQTLLYSMLCSILYFDEKAFEERRAALLAQPISTYDADGDGGDDQGDNNNNSNNGNSGGCGGISGEAGGLNDARLRRQRGGRSLFKRSGEKEGVLLPSTVEARQKFSRFSSRRMWSVHDVSGNAAVCEASETAGNSPLFDIIAASKDAVSQLSDLFAVDKPSRSPALEMTWLALLAAHRRVQETKMTLKLLQTSKQPQQPQQQQEFLDSLAVEKAYDKGREEEVSQPVLPSFIALSLRHLATALAAAVQCVYDMTDPMYLRDENIRRTVGVAIVAGTQGTLLENHFYMDCFATNWWLRSGGPFLLHCHSSSPHLPTLLEASLMNLLAQRTRRHTSLDWLKRATTTALNSLAVSSGATASLLLPATKQWTAALILSNLRDAVYLIKNANSGAASWNSVTVKEEETGAFQEWACEAFLSLLSALAADKELLLMCGYASFIDALYELHFRLEVSQEKMAQFWDKSVLKVVLPAILIGLKKSAEEDNAETHASACESALFVIAELSRFAFWSAVKLPSGLRAADNDFLIRVALYCLRHARRGGGKRASGYGLPAAQLPSAKCTEVMNISATVSFLLTKGSGCSYLHVLDLSNSLLPFSKVQPLYGDRESSCISALQHYLQNVQRVSSSPSDQKQLQEESVKRLSFMASTSISAHLLGYLVRFIEHHLRVQERLARTPHDRHFSENTNGEKREDALSSLTRVEAAPLVLLDYIGYLTCAGSWTMVTWAFNLAETSLRIQRRHQLATTTSLADVATTAIFSQLRALSVPSTQRLPHNLLKSILCLSDMMSGSQMTLLDFERNSPLSGLMKHTTRGEYRTMLFALKQAVVLVQKASSKYRRTQPRHADEDAVSPNDTEEEPLGTGGEEKETDAYFTSSVVAHSSEAQRQLRVFLDCLVACFDSVLDVMRGCALQQDILDDELRDVLLLTLQTLLRVLQGSLQAVLHVPPVAWQRFYVERAHVLWVGLCVTALLGRVAAVDYGRVCFQGNIRRSMDTVLCTVGELVDACLSDTSDSVGADDDTVVGRGKRGGGQQRKKDRRHETPLVDALTTSVRTILSDPQVSHRLAIRLGLGMRQRTDLTALVLALRGFAVASARCQPAGRIIHRVWRALCAEVMQAKRPRVRKEKHLANATLNTALCVPSKDELQLLLESFRDLEKELTESVALRKTQRRQADFVTDWTCENILLFLNSVTEDSSLLQKEDTRGAASDKNDHSDEISSDLISFGVESSTAVALSPLVGMDAAILLQEEEETEGGRKRVKNAELLDALIRQCRSVHLSFGAVVVDDTALALPHTAKVITTHYDCVAAVFTRCTLTEVVTFPCAELIFASLEIFARRRSFVSRENCRTLWSQLTARWKREFLEPYSDRFDQEQRELLQLVRQRRSLMRLTEKDLNGGEIGCAAADPPASFFFLEKNIMAQLAKHDMAPVPHDVEFPSHDDVGGLRTRQKGEKSRKTKSRADSLLQQANEQHVPLDILFTLLIDISRGPCGEAELKNFALVLITYVARRYILLRERKSKNVTNVMRFLGKLNPQTMRVCERRRLPLACAHAADVAGWFLTSADSQAILGDIRRNMGAEEGAFSSAEHGVFEYMRSACLYLHLLAVSVHVCHRFRLFCENDHGDATQRQQQHQQQQEAYYGLEEDGSETAQWGALCGQEAVARTAERRMHADNRQTSADSVNMNVLESILLHFLNVGLTVVDHADFVTHRATSIAVAPDSDHERAQKALLYADELRLMVAVALQDTFRLLLRDAVLDFSLARRVVHRILCSFSCDLIPTMPLTGVRSGKQQNFPDLSPINMVALRAWHSKRPELFVRSPTLLCILSPLFFNEVLSQHMRTALSLSVAQVVASLHFYLRRPDAHLAPLMAATTSILSNTYVRNAALRLFCEELCGQIVDRPSFRDALAPPTVASVQQGAAGSVPNEVLIPFLASICRQDAFVSKNALATVLYHSMNLRPDVFGQPPTADRFARFAISRRGGSASGPGDANSAGHVGGGGGATAVDASAKGRLSLGVQHTEVLLESPVSSLDASGDGVVSPTQEEEEQGELEALDRFKADKSDETATQTHKRALASLSLTLAEVMETAMHFAAMRQLSAEEHKKARAMIRSADDARHERIAAFRSAVPTTSTTHNDNGTSFFADKSTAGYPDAALRIEEPMHFGVVMLHIRFALRKIIHVSMRRLAAQQGPRTLSMMVEMLQEVDPKWHRSHNDGVNNNNNIGPRRQSDGMLAGTLRVLVARSVMCVDFAGEAGDVVGGGAGGIAMSMIGLQRTRRALYMVQRAKRNNGNGSSNGAYLDHAGDGRWQRSQHRRGAAAGLLSASKRSTTRDV